jgi:uncharacterized membrane protein YhaH (DUF805 family)
MNWYLDVLKKYAVFEGRAGRQEFWMFVLFHLIAIVVLAIIGSIIRTQIILYIYYLATLIPYLALGVRRLHDTGRSGWWWLISFIPFGGFVLLFFFIIDSQPGTNKYGPNPKGVQASVAPSM